MFAFALELMVSSLQRVGTAAAETIILATSNPFTALFIGLLITAMIQSSSTTTALTVVLVASGSIPIENAIPIIMGANIGTTITSTIVAMGFINRKKDFRRAVSAGTYDGFFNILIVLILFPLEYYYGFLSGLSQWVASHFFNSTSGQAEISFTTTWSLFGPMIVLLDRVIPNGFILVIVAFAILFTSILLFRKVISGLLQAHSPERFSQFFFKNAWKSFFWGTVTTAAIRSSTITISVVVPIVAQKIVSLRKAAPFILGANIGTTITAFIAALLNQHALSGMSIAIAHFLFNVIGVLIFYPIPALRKIPLELAQQVGKLTLRYRLSGFAYILLVFFFIPFSLIYLHQDTVEVWDITYQKKNLVTNTQSEYRIVSKIQSWNKNGEWMIYNKGESEAFMTVPVFQKNNSLFINKEMFLFGKPGSCWDSENGGIKYTICLQEILPTLQLTNQLVFDSVFVFTHQPGQSPVPAQKRIFISKHYPVILKQEREMDGQIVETESIVSFSKN